MSKFKFDPGLQHQNDAVSAVVDLFESQGEASTADYATTFQVFDTELFGGVTHTEHGVSNDLNLEETRWLKNLKKVQERNDLDPAIKLKAVNYGEKDGAQCPHFSIEMETGTGKTYVYLRTIFELHKRFGFAKFIIVVPSIAIREGTLKSIEMTRDHFRGLYDNVAFDHFVYDSKKLGKVRQFASNNTLQLMIINIQAFARNNESLIFQQERDQLSGRKPVEFVSGTNPIIIIDEPQSVDNTATSQKAIQNLNPMCTLRYSATHKRTYNLLYKLDPIRAYDLRLVKRIEVSSVVAEDNFNEDFLKLEKVDLRDGGGSKVLSLFFIDRVANYRTYDAAGNPEKGKFAQWFEEAYAELVKKPEYNTTHPPPHSNGALTAC